MKKKNMLHFVLIFFIMAICIFLTLVRNDFRNPFQKNFSILSPSFCTTDTNGNTYFIDNSTQRIVRLSGTKEVSLIINGNADSTESFCTARSLTVDDNGTIYVCDTQLADDGIHIESERVLEYSSIGIFKRVVFSHDYTGADTDPLINGKMTDLKLIGSKLIFTLPEADQLSVMEFTPASGVTTCIGSLPQKEASVFISDAEITDDFSALYCCFKNGSILKYPITAENQSLSFGTPETVYQSESVQSRYTSVPSEIAFQNDNTLFFTDIGTRQIKKLSTDGTVSVFLKGRYEMDSSVAFGASPIYNRLSIGNDDTLSTTDTFQIIRTDSAGNLILDTQSVPYNNVLIVYSFLLWILLLAVILALLFLFAEFLLYLKRRRLSIMEKVSVLFVVISLLIAIVVGQLLIKDNTNGMNSEVAQNVLSVTNTASALVNGDLFYDFEELSDFHNASYNRLKDTMDRIMNLCNDSGSNSYYIFYRTDGEQVYRVMDYINLVGTMAPMDTAYKDSYYEKVMTTGEPEFFDAYQDSTGIWTLAVAPVYDSTGKAVAVMEYGRNTIMMNRNTRNNVRDVILSILALVVVLVLVMNEGLQFIQVLRARKAIAKEAPVPSVSVSIIRPLTFCLLIADYMQNAFEPIYATGLTSSVSVLPQNIAVSIALSAEVFSVSISSLIAGHMRSKLKLKPMLYFGALVGAAGFAIRGAAPDVLVFILGKLITGVGMGFVFVALNTFVAERSNPEDVNKGFTSFYASYLAAINVGVVFGSMLAEYLNYKMVYFISALIMVLCTALIAYTVNGNLEPEQLLQKEKAHGHTPAFLLNMRVISFFLFMFVPYLIASYFLYYFYPLYANAAGLSDGKIGQTYLINGICVIYIGPFLAPLLLEKLGKRLTVLFGGFLCVIGMLLFAWQPSILTAILCIFCMGIADSFTFTAMTIYYNGLPAVNTYGISPATGIKSTMENLGTTLAPFLFSSALLAGTANGITTIAVGFTACLGLFALCSRKTKA